MGIFICINVKFEPGLTVFIVVLYIVYLQFISNNINVTKMTEPWTKDLGCSERKVTRYISVHKHIK